ncbi:MAG TPA: DEAD/DEAH box helicase [Verrucomicrobia bacterium]|nr:DEAD/DEAH box helicase [Verrucomicrobiota bacterium]
MEPQSPLELLDYIVLYCVRTGKTLKDALVKLSNIDDLQLRVAAQLRKDETTEWRSIFMKESSRQSLECPLEEGCPTLCFKLGKRAWQIERIDLKDAKTSFSTIKILTGVDIQHIASKKHLQSTMFMFLSLVSPLFERSPRKGISKKDHEVQRVLNTLISHPELSKLVVDDQNKPVIISKDPLIWSVSKESDEVTGSNARLRLCLPDGHPAPTDTLCLPASTAEGILTKYLIDNIFYPGPESLINPNSNASQKKPLELIVPWESLSSSEGLSYLKKTQSSLPDQLEIKTINESLEPILMIECTHPQAEWFELQLELTAVNSKGERHCMFLRNGWQPLSLPESEKEGRTTVYDWSNPSQIVTHFRSKPSFWNDSSSKWSMQTSRHEIESIADWLRGFPSFTTIRLPQPLATLLQNPTKAVFDIDIEEGPDRDWFELSSVLKVEDTELSKEEISLLLGAQGRFVYLKGKGWRQLDVTNDEASMDAIRGIGLEARFDSTKPLRQRFHTLQLEGFAKSSVLNEEARRQIHSRLKAMKKIKLPSPPAVLKTVLRPYQKDGFTFLAHLALRGLGGILADDMGLGKTLQTLAWLMWLKKRAKTKKGEKTKNEFRVLVVCPKSVVDNWIVEPEKFKTGLTVVRFNPKLIDSENEKADILVANYAQFRINADFFQSRKWNVAILDEGQNIKNPTSKTTKTAYGLRATHRLILTGTPIENRVLDLWSLITFAMPGLLGSQAGFKRLYNEKKDPKSLQYLSLRTKPFILRRSKSVVAKDLPDRIEEDIHCELEGHQKKLYHAELKRTQQALLKVKTDRQFDKQRFNFLQSLMRLRQICCDPRLVGSEIKNMASSAKLQALLDLVVPLVEEGHKILVFSQFVSMLELIEPALVNAKISYLMLTGKTENRRELIERFHSKSGEPVFLLSLKAAGAGLNLTAASYVVLYDPWWNPAVEAQAIDRTHRIGQLNKVIAYRLIAKNTIEEKIRLLQKEKSRISETVLKEEALSDLLDLDTLRKLFSSELP